VGVLNIGKNKDLVQEIVNTLDQNGYKAYIVGGAVRDMVLAGFTRLNTLSQESGDVDILTNAPANEIEILFPRSRQVGKTFSICLVNGIEVASSRAGLDLKNFPETGQFSETGQFPEADLGMRDFTINSMAWDPMTNTLVDPFNGKNDLEKKIIQFTRDPKDRICEDPLRMIRACRFAARFEGTLSPDSLQAILTHAPMILEKVAGERIRSELIKAMAMEKPSRFFHCLHDTGLLSGILPCLDRCFGLDGGPFHGETVFEHCLLVGDALPANQPLLRLAGFLHDAGKFDAIGIKDGRVTFAGHDTRIDAIRTDLENLRFSSGQTDYILSLVMTHMRPLTDKTTPKAVRRLLAMLEQYDLPFRDFLRMRLADKKGNLAKQPYTLSEIRTRLRKIQDELSGKATFSINDLEISGKDIMEQLHIPPGPEIGRIKELLFDKVLENPSLNTRQGLEQLIKKHLRS
jgi:tRNA nucleotidyltransferase (CCA-adding enzyme)